MRKRVYMWMLKGENVSNSFLILHHYYYYVTFFILFLVNHFSPFIVDSLSLSHTHSVFSFNLLLSYCFLLFLLFHHLFHHFYLFSRSSSSLMPEINILAVTGSISTETTFYGKQTNRFMALSDPLLFFSLFFSPLFSFFFFLHVFFSFPLSLSLPLLSTSEPYP